jgi:hypothetical protein
MVIALQWCGRETGLNVDKDICNQGVGWVSVEGKWLREIIQGKYFLSKWFRIIAEGKSVWGDTQDGQITKVGDFL